MNETQKVKNLNEAQKQYSAAKREAQDALYKLARRIQDTPAACNGNWGMVGDMNHLVYELTTILNDWR